MSELCARCGQVAQGFAMINGKRYCHPDAGPDCYHIESVWGGREPSKTSLREMFEECRRVMRTATGDGR